jgi:ATP-dependent DNA ligase
VVIRDLEAPYHIGGFKYKFLEEIDAFVIGVEPGISAGSLTLALIRPSDGAVIEIGHVRSGLTDVDVQTVKDRLAQGQFPVFRISYLPASTVGLSLVQPRTSLALMRQDKEVAECTTDQFGPEKAELIALARPVMSPVFRERTRKSISLPSLDAW